MRVVGAGRKEQRTARDHLPAWRARAYLAGLVISMVSGLVRGEGELYPPAPIEPTRVGPDLVVDWDSREDATGWYDYSVAGLGSPSVWQDKGGVGGSGFLVADLGAQVAWPKGVWAFYPLYNLAWSKYVGAQPVNLLLTPLVSVAVNAVPWADLDPLRTAPADLKGGELRFWIAEWNSKTNHAVYSYRRTVFDLGGGGWVRSSVTLLPDPDAWEVHAFAGRPHSLPEIMAYPQQWGFAVIGADPASHPGGSLGFDELRVSRRLRMEPWESRDETAGWYQGSERIAWSKVDHGQGTGAATCDLALLDRGVGLEALYPLWTWGRWENAVVHPIQLLGNNGVEVVLGTEANGSLGGGILQVFAGRRTDDRRLTFYRYRRQVIESGSGTWSTRRFQLTSSTNDWELYAVGPEPPTPLGEVLADPTQWGIGLFGATNRPQGRLHFGSFGVRSWASDWDRDYDTAGWHRGAGASEAGTPVAWRGAGGLGNSGFVLSPLMEVPRWSASPAGIHFPLATRSKDHWANLYEKRRVEVRVNRTPTEADVVADFGGGFLTLFVGRWEGATNYAFYFLRRGFDVSDGGGWQSASLAVVTDTNAWWTIDSPPAPSAIPEAPPSGRERYPLPLLLQSPQQWGVAIVGADRPPSGWLGFDQLELHPESVESPTLKAERDDAGIRVSWHGPPGSATEVLGSYRVDGQDGWMTEEVWDDGAFAPIEAVPRDVGAVGWDGIGALRSPGTGGAARFYRLRFPGAE